MRRWCLHILPKGYTKTRRFGGYWNGRRKQYIAECRELLASTGVAAALSEPADLQSYSSHRRASNLTPRRAVRSAKRRCAGSVLTESKAGESSCTAAFARIGIEMTEALLDNMMYRKFVLNFHPERTPSRCASLSDSVSSGQRVTQNSGQVERDWNLVIPVWWMGALGSGLRQRVL